MTWRHTITPGALKALEIPLVAGREFTTADTADTQPVVVVSETIARTLWPGEDPLGKQLRWRTDLADSPVLTVVGVAADASHRGRLNAMVYADRDVYVPHAQRPDRLMVAVIRAQGDPITIVPSIRQRVRALDPDLPLFEIATMNQHMAQEEAETRFAAMLLTTYGVVRRPWIGVQTQEVHGNVIVTRVTPDGPADAASIRPGDVIVALGGETITSQADFYMRLWSRGAPGVEFPLDVLRGGKIQSVTVTSGDRERYYRARPVY